MTVCNSVDPFVCEAAYAIGETMPPEHPSRLLVVDDDPAVRRLLRQRFEQEGFIVFEAEDSAGAEAALAKQDVDLVTLDLGLQHESGLDIARQIRTHSTIPIIMITAIGDEIDRVVGLEIGADDYIVKPFSLREVVARVRAVLRRARSQDSLQSATPCQPQLVFKGGALDPSSRTFVAASGKPVDLTTSEFNLLEYLLRNPYRVLTRDNIMSALKGHAWDPFDRSIDAAITRLRKKCEPDPTKPIYIKTVRGVGYMFAGDVERRTV